MISSMFVVLESADLKTRLRSLELNRFSVVSSGSTLTRPRVLVIRTIAISRASAEVPELRPSTVIADLLIIRRKDMD